MTLGMWIDLKTAGGPSVARINKMHPMSDCENQDVTGTPNEQQVLEGVFPPKELATGD